MDEEKSSTKELCSFLDCDREQHCKGLCEGHYWQQRRGKELSPLIIRNKAVPNRGCSFEGCERKHMAKGYCNTHYLQIRNGRDLTPIDPRPRRSPKVEAGSVEACSFEGCDRPRKGRAFLCAAHRYQKESGMELRPVRERGLCEFPDCGRPRHAKDLCSQHRKQQLAGKELTPIATEKSHRTRTVEGYVKVYDPSHPNAQKRGWILEHVKVMSEILGRPLDGKETVHHVNGVKDDNRPENLQLWSSRHPKGQRVEDLVEFAREILDLYG